MTNKEFDALCSELTAKEQELLEWKAMDYAGMSDDADRLQNFKDIAFFAGCRPSEVAVLYMLKHIQSITLAVAERRYNWTWETNNGEGLKQRIADARNYLLLLAACIEEEVKNDKALQG